MSASTPFVVEACTSSVASRPDATAEDSEVDSGLADGNAPDASTCLPIPGCPPFDEIHYGDPCTHGTPWCSSCESGTACRCCAWSDDGWRPLGFDAGIVCPDEGEVTGFWYCGV